MKTFGIRYRDAQIRGSFFFPRRREFPRAATDDTAAINGSVARKPVP